jgi:hypothetical protein
MRGAPTTEGTEHVPAEGTGHVTVGAKSNGQRDDEAELDVAIQQGVTTELQRS